MTDIGFYHLTGTTLERALPKLLEKVLASGKRAVVMAGSGERLEALDAILWTYRQDSFLPHGSAQDGNAEAQPVWLTTEDENPNGASILILSDGAGSANVADFERCLEMFDGRDEAAVAEARIRWKAYREAGHAVVYNQQTESGGWERKD
ncbi:MAG: DNA polymerase III subunit chi [Alphaproteobacteria bacterium]